MADGQPAGGLVLDLMVCHLSRECHTQGITTHHRAKMGRRECPRTDRLCFCWLLQALSTAWMCSAMQQGWRAAELGWPRALSVPECVAIQRVHAALVPAGCAPHPPAHGYTVFTYPFRSHHGTSLEPWNADGATPFPPSPLLSLRRCSRTQLQVVIRTLYMLAAIWPSGCVCLSNGWLRPCVPFPL